MATITPIKPHTRIDNDIIDDYLPQIGTYGFTIYAVIKRHLNQKSGQFLLYTVTVLYRF